VAAQLPGSGQLGLAKKLFTRYSWWKLEARPEIIEPHWTKGDYWQPFAGQIPGEVIIAFCPAFTKPAVFHQLESGVHKAFFFNPATGSEQPIGDITPDADGTWRVPEIPIFQDWVIVLERKA
jgi:hypothetical protein